MWISFVSLIVLHFRNFNQRCIPYPLQINMWHKHFSSTNYNFGYVKHLGSYNTLLINVIAWTYRNLFIGIRLIVVTKRFASKVIWLKVPNYTHSSTLVYDNFCKLMSCLCSLTSLFQCLLYMHDCQLVISFFLRNPKSSRIFLVAQEKGSCHEFKK